jgi:hypothetical protein
MPLFQEEITNGTAPAPYIYRQGVPQIRQFLMNWLQPGHAALIVDFGFFTLASLAGYYLAKNIIGKNVAVIGILPAAIACMGSYPNDKPEAIASIAVTTAIFVSFLYKRYSLVLIIGILSIFIRPEISILAGVSVFVVSLSSKIFKIKLDRKIILSSLFLFIMGFSYILLARFFLWPNAKYPEGTPFFMLLKNFSGLFQLPGLLLASVIFFIGIIFFIFPIISKQINNMNDEPIVTQIIGVYLCLFIISLLTVSNIFEYRLFMSIIPITFLFVISHQIKRSTFFNNSNY